MNYSPIDNNLEILHDENKDISENISGLSSIYQKAGQFIETEDDQLTDDELGSIKERIEWDYNRSNNDDSFFMLFKEALRVTRISGRAKLLIRSRYLNLFTTYENKRKRFQILHNFCRLIVAIGSLLVPAILVISQEREEKSKKQIITNDIIVALSAIVSITNAIVELFDLQRKVQISNTAQHALEKEGWSFLLLRGRYRVFKNHPECWQTFLYRTERMHEKASTASDMAESVLRTDIPDHGITSRQVQTDILRAIIGSGKISVDRVVEPGELGMDNRQVDLTRMDHIRPSRPKPENIPDLENQIEDIE